MSIFGAARVLGYNLALQALDAASFILQPDKPFFEPRDGADRLAEREAAEEVSEPRGCTCLMEGYAKNGYHQLGCALWHDFAEPDDCGLGGDSFLDPENGPTPPDTPRYPQKNGVNTKTGNKLLVSELSGTGGYGEQLDRIIGLLENLLASAAPATRKAVEDSADGPEDGPLSPPSSGHPHRNFELLGNDPGSMHDRMLRQRLAEDKDPEK